MRPLKLSTGQRIAAYEFCKAHLNTYDKWSVCPLLDKWLEINLRQVWFEMDAEDVLKTFPEWLRQKPPGVLPEDPWWDPEAKPARLKALDRAIELVKHSKEKIAA